MGRTIGMVAIALVAGCSGGASPAPDPSPSGGPAGQAADPLATDDGGGGTGNHAGGGDARDAGHNPDPGAFGASCASGSDCESNVCFLGGKGGTCSLACTSDTDCPAGADGTQHCNPKGDCRY
ncbi:MAG TPA: hypothetical protein VIF09_28865 [Polyangiaceae bacterium]|jgi:hypothetical protein